MKCSVHHLPVQYLLSPPLIARLCPSDLYWSGMTEQFYYINTFFINCPVTWGPLWCNDESIIFLYSEIPFWYTKSNQNAIKSFTESFFIFPFIWVIKVDSAHTDHESIIILIMEFWCQHSLSSGGGLMTLSKSIMERGCEYQIIAYFAQNIRSNEVFWPSGQLGC